MSRQEGGWCVHRCVFLLKRMTRRLRRESGAYHFNGPLVNLLRQATQRGAGDEWKATCLCRCTPTLPEGNPLRGIDAPTTARTVGLPPRRGKYFLSVRKKVPKKASGTATTGKRLLLPILTAGLAMSRAMELGSFHQLLERARARLFPPSKWAGLFPFAAYRRSVPPQLTLGGLDQCKLGCHFLLERLRSAVKQAFHLHRSWRQTCLVGASWDNSTCLNYFQHKRPAWFQIHAGLYCEP